LQFNQYKKSIITICLTGIIYLIAIPVQAQFSPYNHPELVWRTIETAHFVVHFHDGTERTARETAGIAESIYKPITELYNYEPDGKIHWIIRDHDDYSNGAAYYYDQKIEIWATPLDFELRGQHHWLYNVVTHEFTHIIQLGRSRKGPRWMPQVYFQAFGYEPEKRPDVLYGYPNRIASWPVIGTVVPNWFAEGTAQFQARGLGYEYWDSHRDMILRTRALSGEMLTLNEMGVFASKTSFGNESVYNHGYSLVRYIADSWGDDALEEISNSLNNTFNWSFNHSCRQALGISEKELYRLWRRDLIRDYTDKTVLIRENILEGRVISDEGFGNYYPAFSPDGKKVAFISNKGKDYLSLGNMYIYEIESDSSYTTKCPANGPVAWSSDSRFIAYSTMSKPDKHGSSFSDIYLWDMENEKTIRMTKQARLWHPSFSPDGDRIVAVHNRGGTQNLAILELPEVIEEKDLSEQTTWEMVTDLNNGTQIFQPRFSPDGSWIVCSTANLGTRDIYRYDLETADWTPLIVTDTDDRDPILSSDGRELYWANDRTGIFNIYLSDLETGSEKAITNVLGGAFMPSVSADRKVAYAEFTEKGYSLRLIDEVTEADPLLMSYLPDSRSFSHELPTPPSVTETAEKYPTPFGTLFVMPRVFVDKDAFKPGFYTMTGDMLERINLFGGAAFSFDGEYDLYLDLRYRLLYPTLYLQAYNIVRKQSLTFDDPFVIIDEDSDGADVVPIYDKYTIDYKFNLTEVDIGGTVPIPSDYTGSVIARLSEYKSVLHFDGGGSFDYIYHKGRAFILRVDAAKLGISSTMDIHPTGGWQGWLEYSRENNRFIEGFKIDAEKGTIGEVYKSYNYHRLETDIDYYHKLFRSLVINPRLIAGIISEDVDSFYHLYAGGLIGMRGYSFYSMGGTRMAVLRTSLRFPLLTDIDRSWGPFYIDRIHGALFAEVGDAWTDGQDMSNLKRDIGGELRFKLVSWYAFPTDLQITGAYGLDRLVVNDDTGSHEYGKEWRWYLTLLFGFL